MYWREWKVLGEEIENAKWKIMKEEKINKILNNLEIAIKNVNKKYEKYADSICVDLWELYSDLVIENKKKGSSMSYPQKIQFDNILSLINKVKEFSETNNIEKFLMSLVHLEITLKHSQNHIRMARQDIKKIINDLNKQYPDD